MKLGKLAQAGISTLLLILVLLAGAFIYLQYMQAKKVPPVDCFKVWEDLGKEIYGVYYNKTFTFKDPVDDKVVSGVNVYVFDDKPYYWGQFGRIASMISGATPVATSGSDGKATVEFMTPEEKGETEDYYIILTASNYWSDMYEYTVKFKASVMAPAGVSDPVSYCKELSIYTFLEDTMKNVLTGKYLKTTKIELQKIGAVDYDSTVSVSVPTDADKNAWDKTKSTNFGVSDGYYRIDEIKIEPGAEFLETDTDFEGIHRIELTVMKGTRVIEGPILLFDEQDEETSLRKDGYYTIKEFNGKDILVLNPGETITFKVYIIADTEANATADDSRLGPGEEFLKINIKPAHPLESSIQTIVITG